MKLKLSRAILVALISLVGSVAVVYPIVHYVPSTVDEVIKVYVVGVISSFMTANVMLVVLVSDNGRHKNGHHSSRETDRSK